MTGYYTTKQLKKIEAVRAAVEVATGRSCIVKFDTLPYVWSADSTWSAGARLGYINHNFEFVPS